MKVPACTPCKWSLGVYSGRSSSELWLAACLPTVTVASCCKQVETGESERRSSRSRLTSLQHPRRHRAGRERLRVFLGKQHPSRRSHGQHRGPADQAGVQRSSQKWRGVVTSLLLSPPPYSNPKCVLVVCYSRCQISTDSMLEPPQNYLRQRQSSVPSCCCRSGLKQMDNFSFSLVSMLGRTSPGCARWTRSGNTGDSALSNN